MNKLIEEFDSNNNQNLKNNNENTNRTFPIASNQLSLQKASNTQEDKLNQQEQIKDQIIKKIKKKNKRKKKKKKKKKKKNIMVIY